VLLIILFIAIKDFIVHS